MGRPVRCIVPVPCIGVNYLSFSGDTSLKTAKNKTFVKHRLFGCGRRSKDLTTAVLAAEVSMNTCATYEDRFTMQAVVSAWELTPLPNPRSRSSRPWVAQKLLKGHFKSWGKAGTWAQRQKLCLFVYEQYLETSTKYSDIVRACARTRPSMTNTDRQSTRSHATKKRGLCLTLRIATGRLNRRDLTAIGNPNPLKEVSPREPSEDNLY